MECQARRVVRVVAQLPVAAFDSMFRAPAAAAGACRSPALRLNQYLESSPTGSDRPSAWPTATSAPTSSCVTSQSVEARTGCRGYEVAQIRRENGAYSVYQQGTYNPGDGVHRWMGSAAMDRQGNIALGYSVVNGVDVFPGIRYTGRLATTRSGR